MRYAHTVAQVRAAEAALAATLPPGTLMRRASAGLAAACTDVLPSVYGSQVVALVGTGNNGGDALYAAALLARRGAAVVAICLSDRMHEGGAAALRAAGGRVLPSDDAGAETIDRADLVLDGIVGIGGGGGLRPPAVALVERLAGARALVVAVDLPSGVDADTGAVPGAAVRADVTVSFGTLKPGLLVDPGAAHVGALRLVDIGLGPFLPGAPVESLQGSDVDALTGPPSRQADKYARGVVGVVAGSDVYPGAAVLAVGGALAAGAGMVRYVGPPHAADLVRQAWPEVLVTELSSGSSVLDAGRVQAWVVGPGIGSGDRARSSVSEVLGSDVPVLVDADGLTALSSLGLRAADRSAGTVLTPHAGELGRLLGVERSVVEAHRLEHVRRAVETTGATVLLKGSTTVVAGPSSVSRVNPTGTPFLGTAGSGDTLAGAVGALLARGLTPLDAASAGAWLHGLAGRLASRGAPIRASEIAAAWADAVRAASGAV